MGRDGNRTVEWSLIRKMVHPPGESAHPSDWNYWRREVDVYESGWLAGLPAGVAAPRCFCVEEHAGGSCSVWMEDVDDEASPEWPIDLYVEAARHLGRFGGAYLAGHTLPQGSWMSSQWLRKAVAHAAPAVDQLRDAHAHPTVRRAYPPDVRQTVLELWAERDLFLDSLDRLPRVVCHYDTFRANLLTRHTGQDDRQLVAIDWAFVGKGSVGEDLASLMRHARQAPEVIAYGIQQLDEAVFAGYVEGLRDAGWRGDPEEARLGYTVHAALRGLVTIGQVVPVLGNEAWWSWAEEKAGRSMESVADRQARAWRHPLIDWLGEARQILGCSRRDTRP
jgi:hypothetical protein